MNWRPITKNDVCKIFITFGDHDVTEQICHVVLARTLEGLPGTRGLSLFLVPRLCLHDGSPNRISVGRIEHKLGLKASATCVVDFEGARGTRIGAEGEGLKVLFAMVNTMRLEVAIQGVAIAGAATARAVAYAAAILAASALAAYALHPKQVRARRDTARTTRALRA